MGSDQRGEDGVIAVADTPHGLVVSARVRILEEYQSTDQKPPGGLFGMKRLVLSPVVIGTFLTGMFVAFAASLPLEGSWSFTLVPNEFGIAIETTLKIENQTVTMTNVCTFNGHTAEVSVTVPAQYDDHTIRILSNAEKKIRRNGLDCSVTAEPESVKYRVQGSTLFLSKQGSAEELAMTRR